MKITFNIIFLFLSIKISVAQGHRRQPQEPISEINWNTTSTQSYIDNSWGKISGGKFYKFSAQPNGGYLDKWGGDYTDGVKLTDEQYASQNTSDGKWVGWWNTNVTITLDLGKEYSLSLIRLNAISRTAYGIKFPKNLVVKTSKDKVTWDNYAMSSFPADPANSILISQVAGSSWVLARYVSFEMSTADANSHLFLDELEVFGTIAHSRKLIPDNKCYHGVFVRDVNKNVGLPDIVNFETLSERKLKMILWYLDLNATTGYNTDIRDPLINSTFPAYNNIPGNNTEFFIQLGAMINNKTSLEIARGDCDSRVKTWFTECRDANFPSFIRLFSEMNGNWTFSNSSTHLKYGGDPETYIQAWRRMYNIAEQLNATGTNQIFVWSPQVKEDYLNTTNDHQRNMENYYPGHQYVDWVGSSVYNTFFPNDTYVSARAQLTRLKNLYGNVKPLMISECGMEENPNGGDEKFKWILELFSVINEFDIKACTWFNAVDDESVPSHPVDFRISTSPSSLKGYRPYLTK